MNPTSPVEWLPVLAERLNTRLAVIGNLRSYVDGNAPLPEMNKNTRATWMMFQKRARTNFGGIACQSHANRIRLRGVRVGADDQSEASQHARRIVRDTRLPIATGDAVWDMLTARTGHIVAGVDPSGRAVITSERPESFYAEPDPVRPWRSLAALKVWRDTIAELDFAVVWADGQHQTFYRPSYTVQQAGRVIRTVPMGGWIPGRTTEFSGHPPVWIFDRRDGLGLIEPHLDVIDRINAGKLERLVTAAMQAFRQRALKKSLGAILPEKDESGNPIDWQKIFEPAPGALWDLPEGIDVWESQAADIRQMLEGEKADARDFAAVTGTPIAMLQPDSANQSATGAQATTQQQVDACDTDIGRIKLATAACVATALEFEGVDLEGQTVEVDFENPAWVTLAEKMDAYSKAVAAGMSAATAQKEFLGWSQEKIDEETRAQRRISAQSVLNSLTAQRAPADGAVTAGA